MSAAFYSPLSRQPVVIPVPKLRVYRRGRGFGASGSTPATCTSPNYWDAGEGTCCAPVGTPAAADPCSILNQPGFLAAQAADTGPIASETGGVDESILESLAGYPNNIQTDAIQCWNNPGQSFTDTMGNTVQCPSASVNMNGILVSAYTQAQLAQMLTEAGVSAPNLPGNAPYALPIASSQPLLVNSTMTNVGVSINKTSFNIGDSWTITVTGPPNASVTAAGVQNGTAVGSATPMGTIGSNGTLVLTGTMAASQVGSWIESWTVGGQNAGSVSFTVAAPAGSTGTTGGTQTGTLPAGSSSSSSTSSSTCTLSFFPGEPCLGGFIGQTTALVLGGGLLVLMLLMGGRR